MKKVYVFMADGFETVECLGVVDLLRRARVETVMVSIMDRLEVSSSHDIIIKADKKFDQVNLDDADVLFIPGGVAGTKKLGEHKGLCDALVKQNTQNKRIAAICAGPSVPGKLGILDGKEATCYPGFEDQLIGAKYRHAKIITDGNVTTSKGMGATLELGFELIKLLVDEDKAKEIAESVQFI